MSDDKEQPKPTETEQFARMFAEFMRSSIAHQNQLIPTNPPDPKPEIYRIDSSPLVISERLNGENYALWAVLMKAAVSGRGMISHITGIPSPPARTDPTFERWQQADHCVFTWLMQNMESRLVSRVSQYPTAREVWNSLEVTYARGGGADSPQAESVEMEAPNIEGGKLGFEELFSNPPPPNLLHFIPHQENNIKRHPLDFRKLPGKLQIVGNYKNSPKSLNISNQAQKFKIKPKQPQYCVRTDSNASKTCPHHMPCLFPLEIKMINGSLTVEPLTLLHMIFLIYLICIGHQKVIFKLPVESLPLWREQELLEFHQL